MSLSLKLLTHRFPPSSGHQEEHELSHESVNGREVCSLSRVACCLTGIATFGFGISLLFALKENIAPTPPPFPKDHFARDFPLSLRETMLDTVTPRHGRVPETDTVEYLFPERVRLLSKQTGQESYNSPELYQKLTSEDYIRSKIPPYEAKVLDLLEQTYPDIGAQFKRLRDEGRIEYSFKQGVGGRVAEWAPYSIQDGMMQGGRLLIYHPFFTGYKIEIIGSLVHEITHSKQPFSWYIASNVNIVPKTLNYLGVAGAAIDNASAIRQAGYLSDRLELDAGHNEGEAIASLMPPPMDARDPLRYFDLMHTDAGTAKYFQEGVRDNRQDLWGFATFGVNAAAFAVALRANRNKRSRKAQNNQSLKTLKVS